MRNLECSHEDVFVRRFGRTALLPETELGALLGLRLRERHGADVQLARTEPLNEFAAVPEHVREAASAYADRDKRSTPYDKFVSGTRHPSVEALRGTEL